VWVWDGDVPSNSMNLNLVIIVVAEFINLVANGSIKTWMDLMQLMNRDIRDNQRVLFKYISDSKPEQAKDVMRPHVADGREVIR
jgi:hypothetical protein